jgi:hypothetical protein
MAMVILSYVICLSLGACIGLLGAGFCAAASDKAQHRSNANAQGSAAAGNGSAVVTYSRRQC